MSVVLIKNDDDDDDDLLPSCYRARQGSTGSTTTREREGWEENGKSGFGGQKGP